MLFHLAFVVLLPDPISCGCLGSGTGAGSCPSAPFRAELSQIEHKEGCPEYAKCCTEYGYCHPRSSWLSGFFRDCNGESNGEELPPETVLAERICSGEIIEDEKPSLPIPSPQYVEVKASRTGKSHGKFRNRNSDGKGGGVGDGRGTGKGKRGPGGPVGGVGGVGGNGPAGPDGNCAWDGPGACARRGNNGGIGGVGGVGKIGWAGPKPNCAWDGPDGCKGRNKKNRKNKKLKVRNQNHNKLTVKASIEAPTDVEINGLTERNNSDFEGLLYDYLDDELSYDLADNDEYDFLYEYIDEEHSEKNIEKRRVKSPHLKEKLYKVNHGRVDSTKKKLRKQVVRNSALDDSDLWSVPQWLKRG